MLKQHNALQRFGISLLHQHFDVADDEVLLETTNITQRNQMIQPVKKKELERIEYIETSWRLDTGKPVMGCACIKYSGSHNHWPRPSDVRLKENISEFAAPVGKLMGLNPKTYTYRTITELGGLPTGIQYGFLAQEVESVFPELVSTIKAGQASYKAVDYVGLVPVLLAAFQQQQTAIEALEDRLSKLEEAGN